VTLASAPELDLIIVPGGRAWQRKEVSAPIAHWLLQRAQSATRIATICTGAYALAATGLLDGRTVSVHWRFASDLARRFPRVRVDHRRTVIKDGAFHSASGVMAAFNLSLGWIDEDYGPHVARTVAQELTLELPVPSETAPARLEQPIDRFGDLVRWIMRNLDQDLSIENLARRVGMSRDHFSRAFKSVFGVPPSDFVENLRLNEARRRLSVPHRALKTVASSVGFSDSAKFNRAFERRFGVRPARVLAA
jgi:transcriptional regulator GlxA family with amidase domain